MLVLARAKSCLKIRRRAFLELIFALSIRGKHRVLSVLYRSLKLFSDAESSGTQLYALGDGKGRWRGRRPVVVATGGTSVFRSLIRTGLAVNLPFRTSIQL